MLYAEFLQSMIESSVNDIVNFCNYSNYKDLTKLLSTSKKSPSCILTYSEKWHPSEIRYAYEFLFGGFKVSRVGENGKNTKFSLFQFFNSFNQDIDIEYIKNRFREMIFDQLGYNPEPIIGLTFTVVSDHGVVDKTEMNNELLNKINQLTRDGTLEWIKDDSTAIGCCKELIEEANMSHVETYYGILEQENESIVLCISKYEREILHRQNSTRKYREYVMTVEMNNAKQRLQKEIKGVGKVWRMIETYNYLTDESLMKFFGKY